MYSGTESVVILSDGVTDTFPQSVGLKQGCPISSLLFNIYINDPEEFLKEGMVYKLAQMKYQATSLQTMRYWWLTIQNGMASFGLQSGLVINTNKTEINDILTKLRDS